MTWTIKLVLSTNLSSDWFNTFRFHGDPRELSESRIGWLPDTLPDVLYMLYRTRFRPELDDGLTPGTRTKISANER